MRICTPYFAAVARALLGRPASRGDLGGRASAGLLTERQAAVGAGLHAVLCGLSGLQRHPEALCNDARGSIVLAMLFHFQMNNPLWPDAPPYDMFVYVAAAVIVAWLNRRPLFSKAGAVTDVIPHRTTVGSR